MSNPTGGQAFPTNQTYRHVNGDTAWNDTTTEGHGGMTLRDYFAAQALAGSLSKDISVENHTWVYNRANRAELARDCYEIADAMIAARDAS